MTSDHVLRAERAHGDLRHRIIVGAEPVGVPLDRAAIARLHGLGSDELQLVLDWLADESLVVFGADEVAMPSPVSRYSAARAVALFSPTHRFLLERATARLDPPARRLLRESSESLLVLGRRGDVRAMLDLITTCYGVCYSASGAIEAEHQARLLWPQITRVMLLVAPEFVSEAGLRGLVEHFRAIADGDAGLVESRLALMWSEIDRAIESAPDAIWLVPTDPS